MFSACRAYIPEIEKSVGYSIDLGMSSVYTLDMQDEQRPQPEETNMTSPDLLKVAAIKALLEALEENDAKDAKEAVEMMRIILGMAK